ncbi:hypothetical protein [Bdellovibrio sp. KM01]|uniref:hypothetical protein n=1 Tax=Bdellovibrio sp. KM01 TaxID=2748865 RepID=UPI0015EB0807|nr:hypothetical protein [Bdellovibrio sp. KM01]QLY24341.1 hypothetical protein HW988_12815 [Bdellovibrio sp. KM01]
MKKGLIIIGIAVLAAFLFREGQREGISTLGKSTVKANDAQAERMAEMDHNINTATGTAAKTESAQPAPTTIVANPPPPQMQARERVARDEHTNSRPAPLRPDVGVLKENLLFRSNSTDWKVWTGVRAVPTADYAGYEGDVVGRYGGYVIVKDGRMDGDDANFEKKNPLVLFDERMGNVGIVPGRVMLTLKDNATLSKIQKEYGLKVMDRFDHLHLYFVTPATSNFDLGKFVNVLKRDPRVAKAELEIVSRNYVKN